MSTAGIRGQKFPGMDSRDPTYACLLIGPAIPRIHHSDGLPVYFLTDHPQGIPTVMNDGTVVRLLAYPSAWPGPGARGGSFVFARHERLPFNAIIPVFDVREDDCA